VIDYRVQRLDYLLRTLLALGVVVRAETQEQSAWHLADDVQLRLTELARRSQPLAPGVKPATCCTWASEDRRRLSRGAGS